MATSAKQIAANRANSQKSTGPVTEAGKRITRMNARDHGLSGHTIMTTPAEDAAFKAYSSRLMPDFHPGTAVELDFAQRIVFDSWRLHRIGAIEHNLLALGEAEFDTGNVERDEALNQARAFEAKEKTFNLISLYQQRLERSIHKNLAALKTMQKDREADVKRQIAQRTVVAKPVQLAEKPASPVENGSVCSTPPNDPAPPSGGIQNSPEYMAA